MKENQPQTMPVYPMQYIPNTQDEISLVDIWLTLRKHRKLFLMTAVGITLLGLAIALLATKSYDLTTSLEIGTEVREGIPTPIESPETTKAKLESSLIPMVKNKLNSGKEEKENYQISVSIPKKSSLIILKSEISEKYEGVYENFHNEIVAAISQDHFKFINLLKENMQTEVALANIRLDELQDPTTLEALIRPQEKILTDAQADLSALIDPEILGAKIKVMEGDIQAQKDQLALFEDQAVILDQQLKNINTNQELITSQIKELEVEIQDATALKNNSERKLNSESAALAQVMLGNEIHENRKLLAQLKERLYIILENEKTTTSMTLEAKKRARSLQIYKVAESEASLKAFTGKNLLDQKKLKASITKANANIAQLTNDQKRKISVQQQTLREIQTKLDNLLETRTVTEPTLSSEPTSMSRRNILLIAIFLGGILGVVAVFFAELRAKVAETVSEQV